MYLQMKIELCEDNGFLNDGKPTLVVLVVTKDDGKTVRIPYHAEKTIQELYEDVQKLNSQPVAMSRNMFQPVAFLPGQVPSYVTDPLRDENEGIKAIVERHLVKALGGSEIAREDIVKCVRLNKDLDGNEDRDLVIGREYRVVDVHKSDAHILYEVMDDEKKNNIRIPMKPEECELVKKYVPGPPRKQVFEITKTCKCKDIVALELNGDRYEGTCEKCGSMLTEMRAKL